MWEYATREVCTVPEGGTLRDVIRLMATGLMRHVPVVDDVGRLVGIISDRDLRRLLPGSGSDPVEVDQFIERTRAREVMTRAPLSIDRRTTTLEAIRLLLEHRVSALPIVEGQHLIGIVTESDLLRGFAHRLEDESDALHIEETAPAYERLPFHADQERPLIFLVEPNDSLRRDLCAVLQAAGVDVTAFAEMDLLSDHDGVETPDLILVSAQVEGCRDPLEMLREGYPVTPVVITREGLARREDHRRGKGPLFLPCSPETLLARIRGEIGFNRWTHDLPMISAGPLPHRTATIDIDISVPRQVLVVEPDLLVRQILVFHLRQLGCEVSEAADGHEAVSRLAMDIFDLVTLEVDLPYRTGFEVLEFVQREPESAPRMVVISGARSDDDVVQAFALGALDYIKKPLQPRLLEQRLKRLLAE